MRVGLTGGIGAGKSAVAALFEEFGALVIDTDRLAREAVANDSEGLREIARAWPQVVRDGVLDRQALAEIVFADPSARARLDAIVHPRVRRLALERERLARPGQLVVHVVPLLFETDYAALVERSIVVVAPLAQRMARIQARDGLEESRIRARVRAQVAPEEARTRADLVIENDGGLDALRTRARAVYDRLTGAPP
ncbi:MAG TPA: dephospho-CoA kinase [Candidatus Tumulicola sp.]